MKDLTGLERTKGGDEAECLDRKLKGSRTLRVAYVIRKEWKILGCRKTKEEGLDEGYKHVVKMRGGIGGGMEMEAWE